MEKMPQAPHSNERKFHAEKWEKQADGQKKKWLKEEKTPEDFMRDEAERDNADFEKRLHEEFEAWQVSLKKTIEGFKERAANPETSERKTLILMLGGGMKSSYTAGQAIGLNKMGMTADKVDVVVGASSGSVVATEYVAGPEATLNGTDMIFNALSDKEFISFAPKRIALKNMIDLRVVKGLLDDEEGKYHLDQQGIRDDDQTELHYVMTEVDHDGKVVSKFKDAKKMDSMTEGIVSSMSIPLVTGEIPEIDGQKYYDGSFNALPIEEVIAEFEPTDILILPQTPFDVLEDMKDSPIEDFGASVAKMVKNRLLEKGLSARKSMRESLEKIQEIEGVNIGIMWPPDEGLGPTNIDADKAKSGVLRSVRDTIHQFGGEQPEEIDLSI